MGVDVAPLTLDQTPCLQLSRIGWRGHLLATLISLVELVWLWSTAKAVGIPRDESIYFYAADRFAEWWVRLGRLGFSAFSEAEIGLGFGVNHEHPMLMKSLFGLSHHYLHTQTGWISDPIIAYRLPTMLMASALCYSVIALGTSLGGRWAGACAGLCLIGMPRLFFHAHLSCFDLPVTWMWFALSLAYLGALSHRRWVWGSGVVLGLGLATKLNTFFAPFTLLIVSLLHISQLYRGGHALRPWLKRYGWIALSLSLLGLIIFILHWPWLYHHTWARIVEYFQFHARHVHYPVDYLGTLFYGPPFPIHFPFVFTFFTLPVATLSLGALGLLWLSYQGIREWRSGAPLPPLELFILCNCAAPILVIAWPYTPIFGGTKHWMPAMPYLAIAAGLAFAKLTQISLMHIKSTPRALLKCSLLMILMGPGVWLTHEYGAHGPAWYNSLAGGPPGAAEMRMPRNFWGYSSVELLPWLNEAPEERREVFWHNATGLAVHYYRTAGWLNPQISSTGDWTYPYARFSLYHHQQEKLPEEVDLWWAHGPLPIDGFFIEGVQQIGVYAASE